MDATVVVAPAEEAEVYPRPSSSLCLPRLLLESVIPIKGWGRGPFACWRISVD